MDTAAVTPTVTYENGIQHTMGVKRNSFHKHFVILQKLKMTAAKQQMKLSFDAYE